MRMLLPASCRSKHACLLSATHLGVVRVRDHAQQVVVHQHLPAALAARPDANGGDGQRAGDGGGDGPGDALQNQREAAGGLGAGDTRQRVSVEVAWHYHVATCQGTR